ncbi:hypothetical protein L7F22_035100 [Adiantum nelumboides]|nr:hypothetical protein [Adiantum nelumboides]
MMLGLLVYGDSNADEGQEWGSLGFNLLVATSNVGRPIDRTRYSTIQEEEELLPFGPSHEGRMELPSCTKHDLRRFRTGGVPIFETARNLARPAASMRIDAKRVAEPGMEGLSLNPELKGLREPSSHKDGVVIAGTVMRGHGRTTQGSSMVAEKSTGRGGNSANAGRAIPPR